MRRILIDHRRRRVAVKRGGTRADVSLTIEPAVDATPKPDLLDLEEALALLGALNPRAAKVVELRFLEGLTIEETAEALDVSPRTVRLDWQMARCWLFDRLKSVARDGFRV